MEAIIRVGGAAGTGVASVGQIIAKIASRSGLYVQTYYFYQSVIRGGHNAYHIRVADVEINSLGDGVDYVLALDEFAAYAQISFLNPDGYLIFDSDSFRMDDSKLPEKVELLAIPLVSLARKEGRETRMLNTAGIGVIAGLLCFPKDILEEVLREQFSRLGKRILENNVKTAIVAYDFIQSEKPGCRREFEFSRKKRLLLDGNESITLGGIAAGCRFYAAYPMTPATGILHAMVAKSEKYGIVVKQAEDEIAVINMTIGAGFAGARAMCGTSGGGFALMTEAIGEAGMAEVPIVVVESARGGPSTGLPTRTEQGDLNQLIGASQGDFPKIILAPGTQEECFYTTAEAFNLADKFQCPVIISMDLALSESMSTIDSLDTNVLISRPIHARLNEGEKFNRYRVTDTGISPTAFPGDPELMFVGNSDEHDEDDRLLSDVRAGLPEMMIARRKQMEKRMRKLETALKELPPPILEDSNDASIILIGYGSTKGTIRDARNMLESEGIITNHLHLKYLMPFHGVEVKKILERSQKCVIIEGNYSGQLERLIKAETGLNIPFISLRKYDGDPIYPSEIVAKVKEAVL